VSVHESLPIIPSAYRRLTGECRCESSRLVKVVASGTGAEMFACQCVRCGLKTTLWIPRRYIKNPEVVPDQNSKPPTTAQLLSEERERLRLAGLALSEDRRNLISGVFQQRRTLYDNYLQSPQWRGLRQRVIERAKSVYERCLKNRITEVHHLTYDRLGNERIEDLLGVCRTCHEELHEIEAEGICTD
jgi:hypothetical protein